MKTQIECLEHLARGGALMNQYGTVLYLDKYGGQVVQHSPWSRSKKLYYRLDSPQFWRPCQNPRRDPQNGTGIYWFLAIIFLGMFVWSYLYHLHVDYQAEVVGKEEAVALYEDVLRKLQEYEATAQEIQELGATAEQAQEIIKASEALNADPKS